MWIKVIDLARRVALACYLEVVKEMGKGFNALIPSG